MQEINIRLELANGCSLNDVQVVQVAIFVHQFKERLTEAGVRIGESSFLIEQKSPEPTRTPVHAPGCSGAWCDGDSR